MKNLVTALRISLSGRLQRLGTDFFCGVAAEICHRIAAPFIYEKPISVQNVNRQWGRKL